MLIVILVDAQYLQNVVFSFEKGLNGQNHSLWHSPPPTKKIFQAELGDSPLPLNAIWKTMNLQHAKSRIQTYTEAKFRLW